jgi:hypothetical protein
LCIFIFRKINIKSPITMKQALVLGLALAANAMTAEQVDNELIVAPSGGKFGNLPKFSSKMPNVLYDEQADDELLIRPIIKADDDEFIAMLLPREHFKTEEEYQKYVARMRFSRDDAADDELLIKYNRFSREKRQEAVADDDELFVAPQGKLADLAKKYPGMIMFDEQADDELHMRPLGPAVTVADDELVVMGKKPFEESKHAMFLKAQQERERKLNAEKKKYYEDSKMTEKSRHSLTQAADDELLIRPLVNADDDEFIAMLLPREHFKTEEEYQKYVARMRFSRDDAADDELLIRPIIKADDDEFIAMLLPREHFKTEEEYQKYVARMRFSRDDAADDELLIKYNRLRREKPQEVIVDDDELFVAPQGKLADLTKKYPGMIMFDEQADDELIVTSKQPKSMIPVHNPLRKPVSEALLRHDEFRAIDNLPRDEFGRVVRPPYARFDEVADDELHMKPLGAAVAFDDDELVYLGNLMKYIEKEKIVAAAAHTFDAELRAEKPSHVKAQEMKQMKSELPKMKRKLRPVDEATLLAQN